MDTIDVKPDSFRLLNKLMVMNFRWGFGPLLSGQIEPLGHIMVLTTTGRRSGRKHRTPVNFAIVRGDVYCTAGFGHRADWYRNVLANPQVEVWIGSQRWSGRAEPVSDPNEWLPIYRQVLINSGFAAQAFEGINPHTISNKKLLELGAHSPLVRIKIERALSGPGGPGDLAWMWLAIGAALALALLWRLAENKHGE